MLSLSWFMKGGPMNLESKFAKKWKRQFQHNFSQSRFKPESGQEPSPRQKSPTWKNTWLLNAMEETTQERENSSKDTKKVRKNWKQLGKCKLAKTLSSMSWSSEHLYCEYCFLIFFQMQECDKICKPSSVIHWAINSLSFVWFMIRFYSKFNLRLSQLFFKTIVWTAARSNFMDFRQTLFEAQPVFFHHIVAQERGWSWNTCRTMNEHISFLPLTLNEFKG